ncbi:HAD family phosphatase [Patescibacteria group bacterium]|nr:HAD family phosphatase [Patescibacteria group bacterium]
MFSAVIFDMNGVILNDERVHQQSWRVFCQQHGFRLSEEQFTKKVFGRIEKETFEFLFKKKLSEAEVEHYSNERVDIAISLVEPVLKANDGLLEVLKYLKELQLPIGLATSSRKRYMNFVFDKLDLWNFFDAIVTAEDVQKGKPEPEVFLKAAALLRQEPEKCVAIEDSVSGITSAHAAGMKVIGIATTHTPEEIKAADKVIHSFEDQSPAQLFTSNIGE